MRFYTGKMFPAEYPNSIFIAHARLVEPLDQAGLQRGARDRRREGQGRARALPRGFLTDEKADPPMWGRPVDVLQMQDGALLVSDDYNGVIYRVSYKK